MASLNPAAAIRERALDLGFDAVGFAAAVAPGAAAARLGEFLAAGMHGDMGWMATHAARRGDPLALWPAARSVIALGLSYAPAGAPAAAPPGGATISVYAARRDYHDVVKPKLRALGRWIGETFVTEVKVFVDTAPVMEKPLAAAAGLGWQGKHTNLVSREHGSWLFLGEIFTALALPPDAAHEDLCGGCARCLEVCPTAAFPAPYRLDARRCISYLTIEHRGVIAREFRAAIGNRIYGCDDCLAVCPWNKFARAGRETALAPRPELAAPDLAALAALDDAAFRALFRGTPVKRTGRDRFVRNVLIAVGNSGDPALATVAEARLDDGAALVRGMAVWALSRLLSPPRFAALRASRLPAEGDPGVREEWESA